MIDIWLNQKVKKVKIPFKDNIPMIKKYLTKIKL